MRELCDKEESMGSMEGRHGVASSVKKKGHGVGCVKKWEA